jgi:hypothetical protein
MQKNEEQNETKSKRRRITWQDPNDVRALVIASMGFTNHLVKHYSGLSDGQIYYRLKLAGMTKNRQQFRNGEGPYAKEFIRVAAPKFETRVERSLRKTYQTQPVLQTKQS